jgi:hypothetical protein
MICRQTNRVAALAVALVAGLAVSGCKQEGLSEGLKVTGPSRQLYVKYVSEVMERRCGTLDCHGSDYRPMSILGRDGLRHPAEGNRTGEADSTDLEKSSNYFSVCAIEPEKVARVVDDPGGNAVNTLLLVRKARGQEGHKGGKVFDPWDDSDRCVVGWFRGDAEASIAKACSAALAKLP